VEQGLGGGKWKTLIVFTAQPGPGKVTLDEGRGFISSEEPFAYHPKMGRHADLYNKVKRHVHPFLNKIIDEQ